MPIVKEVTVVTRYTDAQGTEKKKYHNVGVIMSTKNGDMLKLETLPIGWDGWAYLNDPKEREDKPPARPAQQARQPQRAPAGPPPADNFTDDDIPF
jgi:hypothetical protein